MTTLVATSVVRGSKQGESHGGVYLIDLAREIVYQTLDWDSADIDWQGRGWDRGLRGIAFHGEEVYLAASDELFVFTPKFEQVSSFRSPFLKHCHEIACYGDQLYLSSTGFDSILAFDMNDRAFTWGLNITKLQQGYRGLPFNPSSNRGPSRSNQLHLNSVACNDRGMYISGLRTGGMLHFNGKRIQRTVTLPTGTHNAQPYGGGIIFNDTQADAVRFVTPEHQCAFAVPRYPDADLTHTDLDDSRIARQAFARGLCILDDAKLAAGSSPSTIAIHDLKSERTTKIVTLTHDIRNAIHGLEVWPYPVSESAS